MTGQIKTDTQIKALKPDTKQYAKTVKSPKLTKGTLLLLVNPGGKKSFKIRYRYDGKQKGFSLGTYPNTSLSKAVEKHNEAMAVLDQGVDPKVYFDHKIADLKSKLNMQQLFEKWLHNRKTDNNISLSSISSTEWRWNKYIKLHLGKLHVDEIKRQHLTGALELIRDKSREEARKSLSTLNMIFNYAVTCGYRDESPTQSIKASHLGLTASKPRDRWLNLNDVKALWKHLDSLNHKTSVQTKTAIKFALLTGARRTEICDLQWSELDLTNKTWIIPASRSKNKQEHTIYLSDFAVALLQNMESINGHCVYVFPSPQKSNGSKNITPIGNDALSRAVKRISQKMEIEPFTLHDLRRSAATNWGGELEASSDVVEIMLNHVPKNRLVATYQRSKRSDQTKEIWERWGDLLQSHLLQD